MADRKTLESLQALRAVAALLVVSLHASGMLQDRHFTGRFYPSIAHWGAAGVDIFFTISGLVMVVTTARWQPGLPAAWEFMTHRLRRIVPLYWALTTVWAALLMLAPDLFTKQLLDLNAMLALKSYLFIPTFNPAFQEEVPLLYVGWTLDYEMFFYVLFSALLVFTRRWIVPVLASIFVLLVLVGILASPESSTVRTYTSPLLLEFLLGCTIGTLYVRGATLSLPCSLAVGAAGLLLATGLDGLLLPHGWLDADALHRVGAYGIPAALLVASCLFIERNGRWPRLPLLSKMGDSSYSLYLTHVFVIPAAGRVLGKLPGLPGDLCFVAVLAICASVGHVVHWLAEKPADAWLRGRAAALYGRP